MRQFNLARIFSQPEIAQLLERMSTMLGIPFALSDADGLPIFGRMPTPASTLPLCFEDTVVGQIHTGAGLSPFIPECIHYILKVEVEKNLLAKETLGIYREISHLYDLSEKISTSMEISEIASQVIEKTHKLISCDHCAIMLLSDKGRLQRVATNEQGPGLPVATIRRVIRRIMQSGTGEIISDLGREAPLASMICVPLKIKGKAIGVIVIGSRSFRDYPADQLKLLTLMGSQIAVSIENARLYNQLRKAFIDTVYTLADTIEKRDPYTGGHTRRVMEYSLAIGEHLQLPAAEMMNLRLAAILHDIGKIGVKDHILRKGGNFNAAEYEEIKRHPLVGEEILKNIDELSHLIPGIKSHHERFDGGGYPEGLAGNEIPVIARIISVADAFDAMTSDRPYRRALEVEDACRELKNQEGSQFDPQVTRSFLAVFKKKNLKKFLPPPKRREDKEIHAAENTDR